MIETTLDPNIKSIVYKATIEFLNSINKNTIEMRQYIKNSLNICSTWDEVVYIIPDPIINKIIKEASIKEDLIEPSYRFKERLDKLRNKYPEETLLYNQLTTYYYLLNDV